MHYSEICSLRTLITLREKFLNYAPPEEAFSSFFQIINPLHCSTINSRDCKTQLFVLAEGLHNFYAHLTWSQIKSVPVFKTLLENWLKDKSHTLTYYHFVFCY